MQQGVQITIMKRLYKLTNRVFYVLKVEQIYVMKRLEEN